MTAEPCIRTSDLLPQDDGTVAVLWPSGRAAHDTVLSIQPDGSWQTRPITAIGPWEKARAIGNKLVFWDIAYPQAYAILLVSV
jgi:hypothetical protein